MPLIMLVGDHAVPLKGLCVMTPCQDRLMTDIASVHPSDSRAQRDAERVILAALSDRLGVPLAKTSIATANGGRVEIDGASPDLSVLVEIFAHQGKVLSGQGRKLAQDILKLTWIRQQASASRILLAIADPVVELYLGRPKAWLTQAIIDLGVEVVRIELDAAVSHGLQRAQADQYR